MATWTIRLPGTGHIARTDTGALELPDVWRPVLGCLVGAPGWRLGRGAMACKLWPDKDGQAAGPPLWRLKARLPNGQRLMHLDGECIRLAIARFDFVDVPAFDAGTDGCREVA